MANQADRVASVERRLNSFQDSLQEIGDSVELMPSLQGEVESLGTQMGEMQGNMASMGTRIEGIQGTITRFEEFLVRQARAPPPPPNRHGEEPSPPRRVRDGHTPPGREPMRLGRGRFSPPRREPARGRAGPPRYGSPVRPRARGEHRGKKLELPLFHGEDPHGWVFRAERYFTINDVDEGDMVLAASVCMEGKALGWFQWLDAQEPFADWRDL